jgi:hypothetical protein
MHSSPTRGGKRPRAQASPKRERPPAPTTEDGWAKLKHDEILRERDSYGEHVKNHQGLARFYRSTEEYKGNGFLEYALAEHERAAILGQESKTIGKRSATRLSGSEEERAKEEKRIGEKAEKKAMDAILLGEQREEASVGYSKLYAKYRMTLSECVQRYNAAHPAEEELKPEVADQVFKSEAGKASAKWWNVWRELEHRKEVRSKLLTGSLDRVRDPIGQQFANFMLPDNTTIPVGDFISSLAVKRSRPSGKGVQAGKSRYTTAKGNPNQTLLLGNCKVASKEWEPVPAYLIKALEPAIKAYEKAHVYYHDTYLKVTDQYRTLAREHGAALDLCHARVVDPARAGDRRQEGAAKRVDIALLTPLDDVGQHATDEEHMIHEELQCLQEIWRQFGLVVSGVCKAAIDWHYEIIAHMMNTEAMVMCYDCPYSPPSELTFRDLVNDHMSYAPAEALRAIKGGLFVGVKPENVLASDGEPHCRAYTIHGRVHRVLPYAAVLAPDTMQLLVNFSVMRLYHNAVYRDVAYKVMPASLLGRGLHRLHRIGLRWGPAPPRRDGWCLPTPSWGTAAVPRLRASLLTCMFPCP